MSTSKSPLAYAFLGLAIVLLVAVACLGFSYKFERVQQNSYSLADLGLPSLTSPDCSKVDNSNTNYPVSITFNVSDVSGMRDKIKSLSDKYKGQITSDNFSSYPGTPETPPSVYNNQNQIAQNSQASANLTIILSSSEPSFMNDLAALIKSAGGTNTNYSTQNSPSYGSSPVSSCQNYLQNVLADKIQLEILTGALTEQRDPQTLSLISQDISTDRSSAQNDINSLNDFFRNTDNPTVTISIGSI